MTEIAHALRDTLLALTRIPSPIGEEAELCDHVEDRLTSSLGGETITRFHDSLIVHAAPRPGAPRIALVGHLDTEPEPRPYRSHCNRRGRIHLARCPG